MKVAVVHLNLKGEISSAFSLEHPEIRSNYTYNQILAEAFKHHKEVEITSYLSSDVYRESKVNNWLGAFFPKMKLVPLVHYFNQTFDKVHEVPNIYKILIKRIKALQLVTMAKAETYANKSEATDKSVVYQLRSLENMLEGYIVDFNKPNNPTGSDLIKVKKLMTLFSLAMSDLCTLSLSERDFSIKAASGLEAALAIPNFNFVIETAGRGVGNSLNTKVVQFLNSKKLKIGITNTEVARLISRNESTVNHAICMGTNSLKLIHPIISCFEEPNYVAFEREVFGGVDFSSLTGKFSVAQNSNADVDALVARIRQDYAAPLSRTPHEFREPGKTVTVKLRPLQSPSIEYLNERAERVAKEALRLSQQRFGNYDHAPALISEASLRTPLKPLVNGQA